MSPVAPSNNHVGRAAVVAVVGIVVLFAGIGLATLALNGRNSPDLGLGDQTFRRQSTERLSKEIAERGPVFYGDVSGRKDRDIIVQHLGDDPDVGWYAFPAAPVDKARDCTWQWQADEELFRARCDESLTAPADGEGLPQFKVTVSGGTVDIDLNAEARTTTTTEPDTATTTTAPG